MNNDLPARGCGLNRIKQEIGNNLNDLASKAHDHPFCLKALNNHYSLAFSFRTIKVQYLTDQFLQLEFSRPVVGRD